MLTRMLDGGNWRPKAAMAHHLPDAASYESEKAKSSRWQTVTQH